MEHKEKLESIASHVIKTFRVFRDLENALAETPSSDNFSEGAPPDGLLPMIENNFTRFKMWAGNQAAHQSGPSSLDHRLREAPHLQQQVVYLLKDICESLEDATLKISEISDSLSQVEEHGKDQEVQSDKPSSVISDHDQESDFSDSDSDCNIPNGVLSTALLDVGEAIDCLLRLSVAIANPAPHERFRKLGAGPSEDVSFYEPHDITYVKDKFPKISDELANALGRYITRRRQFFKYRYAHHEKLVSGIESLALNKESDTCRTEIVPQTIASSLPEQFKASAKFDPQAAVVDEDMRSDTGMSQTSYATSAGFVFEGTDLEMHEPPPPLRVPPRPSAAADGIFECPFCYRMISAKTRAAWKRHVFGDLRPYTCVFSHCIESTIDFDRRHNWQLHVSKNHWRSWSCPFKCQQPFSSAPELSRHINNHHLPNGSEEELKAITALGDKPAPEDTSSQCLLCGHSTTGLKKYIKHVGRHLEQLALFTLPDLEREDVDEETESNNQNSAISGTDDNSLPVSSTSPSPILAPQHPSSSGLAVKEEKSGLSDDNGNTRDLHGWSKNESDKEIHSPYEVPQKCVHGGCWKEFTDPGEKCEYHPGRIDFYDGQKGWFCCKPRVLTVDELFEIPPCTIGTHSTSQSEHEQGIDGVFYLMNMVNKTKQEIIEFDKAWEE
ncbi:transcription factor [Fusarium longipes]|uniref:Transcription factor n=1 Tax=Fusarium longipes TaxID=694270 RepID=A0A395RZX9_9HYPO|nr:transcription factor [Fusarium longipes]